VAEGPEHKHHEDFLMYSWNEQRLSLAWGVVPRHMNFIWHLTL
jgi:hypothetical protein